jgi:hypothetical protein
MAGTEIFAGQEGLARAVCGGGKQGNLFRARNVGAYRVLKGLEPCRTRFIENRWTERIPRRVRAAFERRKE